MSDGSTSSTSSWLLTVLGVGALIALAWLVRGTSELQGAGVLHAGHDPEGPSTATGEVTAPAAPTAVGAVGQSAKYLDPLTFLPEFWGARWPEVEAKQFPAGLENSELPLIRAWEVAAPHLVLSMAPDTKYKVDLNYRRLMAWPGWEFTDEPIYPPSPQMASLSPESVASAIGDERIEAVDQVTIERWDQELLDVNLRLDQAVRTYLHALGDAVRAEFAGPRLERAPVALPDRPSEHPHFFGSLYSPTMSAFGWQARLFMVEADFPELVRLRADITALQDERRAHVQAQL